MSKKKYLSQKEVAQLLNLPLVTIQRWEHQGKIPFKSIKNKRCYKSKEILDWAKSHEFVIKPYESKKSTISGNILSKAIENGGLYYQVEGVDIYSVLENALDRLSFWTPGEKVKLLNELLDREELASTGIGKGIAIPHTRNRLDLGLQEPYVPVFFLKNRIDFNSIDDLPVSVIFMIFTTNTEDHLKILSKLSFCLQKSEVIDILRENNDNNNLLKKIIDIEIESEN